MDYNSMVSSLREIARDALRLEKVNVLRAERLTVSSELGSTEQNHSSFVERLTKRVAVLGFKVSNVQENDPEKDDKLKDYAAETAECQKSLEDHNKNFAQASEELNKSLVQYDEMIAKVQSGETKVSAEALTRMTESLITEVAKAAAVQSQGKTA